MIKHTLIYAVEPYPSGLPALVGSRMVEMVVKVSNEGATK
jgi:hypothetical protein